jgi:hypothetical protein
MNRVRLGADRSHSRRRNQPIFAPDRTHSRRRSKPLAMAERTHFSIGPKSARAGRMPSTINATVIGIETSASYYGFHPHDSGTLRGWGRSHFRDRGDPRFRSKPLAGADRSQSCCCGSKPILRRIEPISDGGTDPFPRGAGDSRGPGAYWREGRASVFPSAPMLPSSRFSPRLRRPAHGW